MKAFARAMFKGLYKSQPGEIHLKMGDIEIEVEVYRARGDNWSARAVKGGGQFKGIEAPIERALVEAAGRFDKQLTAWPASSSSPKFAARCAGKPSWPIASKKNWRK